VIPGYLAESSPTKEESSELTFWKKVCLNWILSYFGTMTNDIWNANFTWGFQMGRLEIDRWRYHRFHVVCGQHKLVLEQLPSCWLERTVRLRQRLSELMIE
jgi:hypothetical protein